MPFSATALYGCRPPLQNIDGRMCGIVAKVAVRGPRARATPVSGRKGSSGGPKARLSGPTGPCTRAEGAFRRCPSAHSSPTRPSPCHRTGPKIQRGSSLMSSSCPRSCGGQSSLAAASLAAGCLYSPFERSQNLSAVRDPASFRGEWRFASGAGPLE